MIKVDKNKCPKDHACPMVKLCPKKAISQKNYDAPKIDKEKCIKCLLCVKKCPYNAFYIFE
jgi:ferredoxin